MRNSLGLLIASSLFVSGCASLQLVATPQDPNQPCPIESEDSVNAHVAAQRALYFSSDQNKSFTALLNASHRINPGTINAQAALLTEAQVATLNMDIKAGSYRAFTSPTPSWASHEPSSAENEARARTLQVDMEDIEAFLSPAYLVSQADFNRASGHVDALVASEKRSSEYKKRLQDETVRLLRGLDNLPVGPLTSSQKAASDALWAQVSKTAAGSSNLYSTSETSSPVKFDSISATKATGELIADTLKDHGADVFLRRAHDQAVSAALDYIEKPSANTKTYENLMTRRSEYHFGLFLREYVRAYFHDGHILTISGDISKGAASLAADIKKEIGVGDEKKITDQITKVLQKWCNTDTSTCSLASPGKAVFVSRSGGTFSSEELGYDGTYHHWESAKEAPALARVLVEAFFDAKLPHVPAASNSTACEKKLYSGIDCLTDDTKKKYQHLDDAVALLDADAARADSLTGSITGSIVRGGYIVAINNEAVSSLIENLFAVTARKESEQLSWRNLTASCKSPLSGLSWSVQ